MEQESFGKVEEKPFANVDEEPFGKGDDEPFELFSENGMKSKGKIAKEVDSLNWPKDI